MSNKKILIISLSIIAVYFLIAVFAPFIAPYNPNEKTGKPFEKPSQEHLLGTNDAGYDILSEVIMGTQYSLGIGFCVALITMIISVTLGICSGYFGGIADIIIMRIADFFLTIPYIPTVILLSAVMPSGFGTIVAILSLLTWPQATRVIRSQVIKVKQKEYIYTIKAMGASHGYILTKHIIREILPIVAYQFTDRYKRAILSEATLSFLGLGSPTIKSWGTILYYAQQRNAFTIGAWLWWVLPPGIMLSIFAFALMLFSYCMEGSMDKRLEGGL
ncbi:MAG: ABC transporter permease [Lachnospiraceae bacterium]|nr:ABC transporter permease [Lachnospiraceae bacterium]